MASLQIAAEEPRSAKAPLIRLRDVGKFYRTGAGQVNILNHITLDVAYGEFLSVMGPSGAGKTTLLNILGMFDGDWTGEYDFAGEAVHTLKPKQRREPRQAVHRFRVSAVSSAG